MLVLKFLKEIKLLKAILYSKKKKKWIVDVE